MGDWDRFPRLCPACCWQFAQKRAASCKWKEKGLKVKQSWKKRGWEKKGSTAHQQRLRQWSDQPSANLTTFQTSSSAICEIWRRLVHYTPEYISSNHEIRFSCLRTKQLVKLRIPQRVKMRYSLGFAGVSVCKRLLLKVFVEFWSEVPFPSYHNLQNSLITKLWFLVCNEL